jgi:hypothetical protein
MAFTSGVHFWEIYAPLGCMNLQVGVYNPVTKVEILHQTVASSPRVITMCLDLFEGVTGKGTLKKWLNGNRSSLKSLDLDPIGGPWVPCIKISMEGNTVSMNPFASEPSSFYEFYRERHTKIEAVLMPLIQNTICVSNLPELKAGTIDEAVTLLP